MGKQAIILTANIYIYMTKTLPNEMWAIFLFLWEGGPSA